MTEIVFDEFSHTYYVDGQRKDSVTQCLGEYLKVEISGAVFYVHTLSGAVISKDIFEAAQDFGTALHKAVHLLLKGNLDISAIHPDLLGSVLAVQDWLFNNVAEWMLAEQRFYSRRYDFCGCLDIYGRLKKYPRGRDLLDIKTGLSWDMADPQTAAYQQLIVENVPGAARAETRRWVLHVPRDGSDCDLIRMNRKDSFGYFLNMLQAKRWRDASR